MVEVPGDVLGSEIEYAPGKGAYSDGENVRAAVMGEKEVDNESRTIKINTKFPMPKMVHKGLVYFGVVTDITGMGASVELIEIASKNNTPVGLPGNLALLRVADVSNGYVKSIRDAVRIGDIVKVKVLRVKRGAVDVTMKDKGLGVVKAFCSKCRSPLKLKGSKLYCENCNSYETRRLGYPYLER